MSTAGSDFGSAAAGASGETEGGGLRLLRIRLRDFRGVAEREIEPLPRGVTVIQGPNESGKTTLAEAVDLLFDLRDSSTDRRVREAQPEGRDVGSEVEVEAACGAYRFRYFKRFNRQPETVLEVGAPHPETLTGREAHERALEILAGGVDAALWKALRVRQGGALGQAELGGAPSLLAALDRAASGGGAAGSAGAREEALYERARAEAERYFTPGRGQPTGELREALAAESEAHQRAEALAAELARLEDDVERSAALERRVVELRGAAAEAAKKASAARTRLAEVERLEGELARRRAELADEQGRHELLRELADAGDAEAEVAGRLAAARRQLAEAETAHAPAAAAAGEAAAAVERAELEAAAAQHAERLAAVRSRLAELAAAQGRLAEIDTRRAALAERLAAAMVNDRALREIEQRDREAERARAAVDARRAVLALTALAPLDLEIGGEPQRLAEGERLERQLAEPVELILPGVAALRVDPGADLAELRRAVEEAERRRAEACAGAGVGDLDGARQAHRDRREIESALQAADATRAELLGGRTPERLAEEIAALRRQVEDGAAGGEKSWVEQEGAALPSPPDPPPGPPDPQTAEAARRRAEEALEAARRRHREAAGRRDELARELEKVRHVVIALAAGARAASDKRNAARQKLGERAAVIEEGAVNADDQLGLFQLAGGERRPEQPELELGPALETARRRAEAAREAAAAARRRLAEADPEGVRRAADEATAAAAGADRAQRDAENELTKLRGRLEGRGEIGLYERHAEARAEHAEAERRASSARSRAAAAKTLFEALTAARDRARQSYSEPLRAKIVELGRPLFGDDFAVVLDDELRIARRTAGGVTLDYDRLSAGAKEQLALLAQLAAALLVAPQGGAPLILDDALGSTDPGRLAALADVLRLAGERCQVIVLTCYPDRFAAVEGARVVAL